MLCERACCCSFSAACVVCLLLLADRNCSALLLFGSCYNVLFACLHSVFFVVLCVDVQEYIFEGKPIELSDKTRDACTKETKEWIE